MVWLKLLNESAADSANKCTSTAEKIKRLSQQKPTRRLAVGAR